MGKEKPHEKSGEDEQDGSVQLQPTEDGGKAALFDALAKQGKTSPQPVSSGTEITPPPEQPGVANNAGDGGGLPLGKIDDDEIVQ